jgi:hypothetical protein
MVSPSGIGQGTTGRIRRPLGEIFGNAQSPAAPVALSSDAPRKNLNDIFKEKPETSAFENYANAGGRILTKRGVGIIQLLDEATGGALLSPAAREASYKVMQKVADEEAADDSAMGFVGGVVADPLMMLPLGKVAQGAGTLAKIGGLAKGATAAGFASGATSGKTNENQDRLMSSYESAATAVPAALLTAGAVKGATSVGGALARPMQTLGKALGVSPERVAAMEAAGLAPNVAAASEDMAPKLLYNSLGILPGSSGKISKTTKEATTVIQKSLDDLGYTGAQTPTTAGNVITGALERFQQKGADRFRKVDDYLGKLVKPTDTFDTFQLAKRVDEITNRAGLTPQQVETLQGSKAIQAAFDLIDQPNGVAPYEAVKRARSIVGNLMKEPHIIGNTEAGIAKQVYGALTDTLREGVGKVGGEKAVRAFDLRNKLYSDFMDENEAVVQKLLGKARPEDIYQSLVTGTKIGGTTADRVMGKLNPVERDMVRDAVIYQQGGGEKFSPLTWFSKYEKMSPEAKKAFFKGKEDLYQSHEKLAKAVQNFNDVQGFGNPSRSGWIATLGNIFAGGSAVGAVAGFGPLMTNLALGAGGARVFAEGLTNPQFTKALAQAVEAAAKNKQNPPKGAINIIGRQLAKELPGYSAKVAAVKSGGMSDSEESQPMKITITRQDKLNSLKGE